MLNKINALLEQLGGVDIYKDKKLKIYAELLLYKTFPKRLAEVLAKSRIIINH